MLHRKYLVIWRHFGTRANDLLEGAMMKGPDLLTILLAWRYNVKLKKLKKLKSCS